MNMNNFVPFVLIFFVITSLIAVTFNPVSVSGLIEDSWNTKTPMNIPRHGVGVVATGGKIYVIGGSTGGFDFVGTTECYDPANDTWVTLRSMPTSRGYSVIVECQGKIYCMGGYDTRYLDLGWWQGQVPYYYRAVEVYDPVNNRWSSKPLLPNSMSGSEEHLDANAANGKIFVLNKLTGAFVMYDPVSNLWTGKAHAPGAAIISVSTGWVIK